MLLLASLLVLAPFLVYPVLVMELMCFALFASAYHLSFGYGGLLSFGHAAFFGLGAFMTGHALLEWHVDPALGLFFSTASSGVLGLVFGLLALRRSGIYFSMITLALAQIVYFVFLETPLTGGEDGLQGIPRMPFLGVLPLQAESVFAGVAAPWGLYVVVMIIFLAVQVFVVRWLDSPSGLAMRALRAHEPRAQSLGLPVDRLKLSLFVISAALSGLAGGLKALVLGLATLADATWSLSGEVILMNLLGGPGFWLGPIVGAFFLRFLHHEFASLGAWFTVVLGLTFVVCVLLFRQGLVGEFQLMTKRFPVPKKFIKP